MCSWCWGFAPTVERVRAALADGVEWRLVLGGLAPDSDEPMPAETQRYIQSAWDAVEQTTGAHFNREFWSRCQPRRSTWPACRAVLAAETLGRAGHAMFAAIQRAYYIDARNPSERETLVALASESGLDPDEFAQELDSDRTRVRLAQDFAERDRLRVSGFPTLCFERGAEVLTIARGHAQEEPLMERLRGLGAVG